MGQKVNPIGMRLTLTKDWRSTWYAEGRNYAKFLSEDNRLRAFIMKGLDSNATGSLYKIEIERFTDRVKIVIHTSRVATIIGKKGEGVDTLRKGLARIAGMLVYVDVKEVKKPDLCAPIVASGVAQQLERRVMFRRAMKRAVQNVMRAGAEGVKVSVGGRLGGAEIARTEWYREGRVPLHTFRADIDYASVEATTTYGIIGIKVWIFKGEKTDEKQTETVKKVNE